MDFSFSPEQQQFRDSLRNFLTKNYDFPARQTAIRSVSGWRPEIWRHFAELGILALPLPEESGGMGGGPVDVMVVMEELGRALAIEPYLETIVLSGHILANTPTQEASALLAAIAAGEAIATLAWEEPATRHDFSAITATATQAGASWRLTAQKSTVIAAPWATHFIVAAQTPSGLALFLTQAAGIPQFPYPTIDGKRAADLTFAQTEATLLTPNALPLLESARDAAIAAQCAEAMGVLRKLLDDTIAYTKQRKQFGQPISNFQALQHRMADMYMQLEMAISATYLAVLQQQAEPQTRALACSTAKVTIARAARFIGQSAVQLHGGMGMTDELAISHYFKRATAIEMEFGSPDYHLARHAKLTA